MARDREHQDNGLSKDTTSEEVVLQVSKLSIFSGGCGHDV
jgi:hypothetical protein